MYSIYEKLATAFVNSKEKLRQESSVLEAHSLEIVGKINTKKFACGLSGLRSSFAFYHYFFLLVTAFINTRYDETDRQRLELLEFFYQMTRSVCCFHQLRAVREETFNAFSFFIMHLLRSALM